ADGGEEARLISARRESRRAFTTGVPEAIPMLVRGDRGRALAARGDGGRAAQPVMLGSRGRSSVKEKRVPWSGALSTWSSPPISVISLRQIDRPRPELENA